ncbi:MAG: 1-(5-phosphoribosyl)-5-[(5-phosphoribosylamino)methylideneamino] imidazole-4-carboxamide isomerase [Alphaproteobacteria bacterium]|nr:MAG: 1-(5-phosphoribosyl)-5-[(5-phosphoribosylamino)methylideneamino] imidazole-4-carboxamide isomerase [Alphaproteobacteria bacterium]
MILFPAIDLKNGQCVRLEQGDMARATVFNNDPGAQAAAFAAQGFSHLHIVDLDGAFAGVSVNRAAVEAIVKACQSAGVTTQLGGGIRSLDNIEAWLGAGIDRVILGTVAQRDPDLVREACRQFAGRIIVGIDARAGFVAVEGWAEVTQMTAVDLARQFEDAGVAAIIYTDIDRDGLLKGVNIEATQKLASSISIPVIASGGLAGLDDVKALLGLEDKGIVGAISGRALYDGRLDAAAALALDGVR